MMRVLNPTVKIKLVTRRRESKIQQGTRHKMSMQKRRRGLPRTTYKVLHDNVMICGPPHHGLHVPDHG